MHRPETGPLSLRALAWPLAAITLAHLALLLAWSVAVPTFRGADEHVHHDFLRALVDDWSYPEYDELPVNQRTLAALADSPVYPKDARAAPADAATERSARTSWSGLGPDVREQAFPFNQMPQHPPLYYTSTAAVLRVLDADGSAPLDRVVWQLRLMSVLSLLPLPLLAADVTRRFTSSAPVVVGAAGAVLAVPQLSHLGAIVSNDPLMILLGSVTLAGVARLVTGDRRWVTVVLTGIAAGLALFTKGFAVPLVPAVALACLWPLLARRSGDARRRVGAVLSRSTVIAVLAFVFGGWWWIRNVVAYGNPQPGVNLRDRVEGVDLDVVAFAGDFSERLAGSFWGNFGWREAPLPIALVAVLTVVLVGLVVVGCWRRWARVVLVVPAVAAGAMVLSAGWNAYEKTGVSYATQGRYLFTGIIGLAGLAALGTGRLFRGPGRWQPSVTLVVAFALQAIGLVVAVERYWAGDGLEPLRALGAFSPLPGPVTAAILAAVPVTAIVALVASRPGRMGRSPGSSASSGAQVS